MTQDIAHQEVQTGSGVEMNYKKCSRNGDDFVRGVQESQAGAAGPRAGRRDKSALQGCLWKNREEKKLVLNHCTMLA